MTLYAVVFAIDPEFSEQEPHRTDAALAGRVVSNVNRSSRVGILVVAFIVMVGRRVSVQPFKQLTKVAPLGGHVANARSTRLETSPLSRVRKPRPWPSTRFPFLSLLAQEAVSRKKRCGRSKQASP